MEFEWNSHKAIINEKKHGVSFTEAMSCFYDTEQIAFYDPEHSQDEDREILIGHSNQGKLLIVVYVLKPDTIRIISARKATLKESKLYAQGI
jgi:uncharacterized protein